MTDDPSNFTVLLPARAGEDAVQLRLAISSVLNVTPSPREVLICVDAPMDEPLAATLSEFGHRVRLCLSPRPGLPECLNHGAAKACTPWLARMDADDISLPDRFESQVSFLRSHPEVDVLGGAIEEFWPDGRTRRRVVPLAHPDVVRMARWRSPTNHMTVMIRRQALLACGGYPEMRAKEDYALWLRMIGHGARFANLPQDLVRARLGWRFSNRRAGIGNLASEWRLFEIKCGMREVGFAAGAAALVARSFALTLPGPANAIYQRLLR